MGEEINRGLAHILPQRGVSDQVVDALFVETDHPAVLPDTCLQDGEGRTGERAPGPGDHGRKLPHASDGIGDVVLARQARLGEEAVDAAGQVFVVGAGILLERVNVLGQPDPLLQVVPEDLIVDLGGPTESFVVNFVCESFEDLTLCPGAGLPGLHGEILDLVIVAVVAHPAGMDRELAQLFLEVILE